MRKSWWRTLVDVKEGPLALLIPQPVGKPTRGDWVAGVTVAVVALPLAVALSLAAGAPPEAGLYAAIFGGLFASVFGSSPLNISGPTGAMTVVLVGVVSDHGLAGMALAGLMAGVIQVLLGISRAGHLVKFLPHSLIAGFTTGIAVVIFLGQVATFTEAPIVGLVTVAVMTLSLVLWRNGPAALIGLAAGIAVNVFVGGPSVSDIPQGLPSPSVPNADMSMLASAFGAAVTICLLGSIEGLLTASIVDSMKRSRHDPNRELVGQGVGNVVSALMGGVPITGAVARTGVAVRSGGNSVWTGIIHSLVLLLFVLVLAPLVHFIPVASLAGILMVTCFRMVDWDSLRSIPRAAPHYSAVLLVTLLLTIVTDVIVAVGAGFTLAMFLFVFGLSRNPLREAHVKLSSELASEATVHVLNGPLFFGVVKPIVEQLEGAGRRVLVLDMHRVPLIDSTGAMMLQDLAKVIRGRGGALVVWGLDRALRRSLIRYAPKSAQRSYFIVGRAGDLDAAIRRRLQELDRLHGKGAAPPSVQAPQRVVEGRR